MPDDRIKTLDPRFRPFVSALLAALDREQGLRCTATEWRRTQAHQDALYAQGRESLEAVNLLRSRAGLYPLAPKENAYTVTRTRQSKHIDGLAVDICPVINGKIPWNIRTAEEAAAWKRIGSLSLSLGLRWGGSWAPLSSWGIGWDPAHHEYAGRPYEQ
jgi:peptidoglycan L-alanyl-D-glutamate endopeptidase CwlK